jgi:hypothetical protein
VSVHGQILHDEAFFKGASMTVQKRIMLVIASAIVAMIAMYAAQMYHQYEQIIEDT